MFNTVPPAHFVIDGLHITSKQATEIMEWCVSTMGSCSIGTIWEWNYDHRGQYHWWIVPEETAALFRIMWSQYPMRVMP